MRRRVTVLLVNMLAAVAVLLVWASAATGQSMGSTEAPATKNGPGQAQPAVSTPTGELGSVPGNDGSDVPLDEGQATLPEDCGPAWNPASWTCRAGEAAGDAVAGAVAWGFASVFDQLYDWVADGAGWAMGRLVSVIDTTTRPTVTAGWFRDQYRTMTALAMSLVLPLLMLATLSGVVRQDWRGVVRSYFVYLPAAALGTAVAVPLVDMLVGITDALSGVLLDTMRGDVDAFLASVRQALDSEVGAVAQMTGVAPFLAFVTAALIALGALAVWVELVLRSAGIYVTLFLLPLGFTALVWPATRRWYGRLVKLLAALILAKFVIVAVIALAGAAMGGGPNDGFGAILSGTTLMLMAAFAPAVLFRVADAVGDDAATAVATVTQHRTSPVPAPSPGATGPRLYARMMNEWAARDSWRSPASAGPASTGAAAAGAAVPALAAVGAGASGAAGATGAARAAGERLGSTAEPRPSASSTAGRPPGAPRPAEAAPLPHRPVSEAPGRPPETHEPPDRRDG